MLKRVRLQNASSKLLDKSKGDVNVDDALITTMDEVNKITTVNKLDNNYKKGAVIAKSTVDIYIQNQEMSTDMWRTYDITEVM